MRIGVIGIRGIPSRYGGFETCAEETTTRWTQKGHKVIVYTRNKNILKQYKAVQLKYVPFINTRSLGTFTHTILSALNIIKNRVDVVHVYNLANIFAIFILKLFKIPTVLLVDGIEWKRTKWNWIGKSYYKLCEIFLKYINTYVIFDSMRVLNFYKEFVKEKLDYISYGSSIYPSSFPFKFERFNSNDYILFVGRLVPEKNIHTLIKAFIKSKINKHLVIVGDDPYEIDYKKKLIGLAKNNKRIHFLGYVYGEDVISLYQNAYLFVQPSTLEGTSPSLLTAMGTNNCVIVKNIPENRETIGKAGLFFNTEKDLTEIFNNISVSSIEEYSKKALNHVIRNYSWDNVSKKYMSIFELCIKDKKKDFSGSH